MLKFNVIFIFIVTHGSDNIPEECFPRCVLWNTAYTRCSVELKDSGDE